MKAAVFSEPKKLQVEDYSIRKLFDDELLIKVEVCGLCGTDFHIFHGEAPSKPPLIPGHEFAGIVVERGNDVYDFEIGDHVVIDPNIFCGKCYYCRTGQIQFCENLKALGVTQNGGFSEYSIVPSSQAYKIPNDFPFRSASFAEPLSCCVHGMDQAEIRHGESVAIVGGGTIGLLMLQLAKISGAAKILVIEPIEEKRITALKLGADYVFDPFSDKILEQTSSITSGGPDVVIECAGNSNAAELAIKLPKKGGRVVVFGLSPQQAKIDINLQKFFHREITIKGSLLNPFTFSRAIELLISKKVLIKPLKPVVADLNNLYEILTKPRNFSVTKYQITVKKELNNEKY